MPDSMPLSLDMDTEWRALVGTARKVLDERNALIARVAEALRLVDGLSNLVDYQGFDGATSQLRAALLGESAGDLAANATTSSLRALIRATLDEASFDIEDGDLRDEQVNAATDSLATALIAEGWAPPAQPASEGSADESTVDGDRARYLEAAHGMQSGVAMELNYNPKAVTPKHLRVGVNSALVNSAALATLLIERGIFTMPEYVRACADEMEAERDRYAASLSVSLGSKVRLS